MQHGGVEMSENDEQIVIKEAKAIHEKIVRLSKKIAKMALRLNIKTPPIPCR